MSYFARYLNQQNIPEKPDEPRLRKKKRAGKQPKKPIVKPYLADAVELCGGPSKLARYLGIKQNTISGWLYDKELSVASVYAKAISELTLGFIDHKDINLERYR